MLGTPILDEGANSNRGPFVAPPVHYLGSATEFSSEGLGLRLAGFSVAGNGVESGYLSFPILSWANRSAVRTVPETLRTRKAALWLITLGTAATLAVILYVPYVRAVFKFPFLHPNDLLVALALGLGSITWFEVLKSILRPNSDEMRTTTERGHVWYLKRIARITIGWSFIVAGIAGLFLPLLRGVLFLMIDLVIL